MISLLSGDALDGLSRSALGPGELRETQLGAARLLLERARYLDEEDRRLLRLAVKYRLSVRELADLAGCNHGSMVRRLRRLKQRLSDPLVTALVDARCPLTSLDRELALEHFLRRRPLRLLATAHGLSPREVKRRILYVKGWASGRREGARATRAVLRPT